MKNGIILQQGQKCLDFSYGQGFYLNPSFGDAKAWALQKSRAVPSIIGTALIYNFSRDSFKGVLLNTKDEWQQVVRHYRSEMVCSILKNLKNWLENTGYIFAEIAS